MFPNGASLVLANVDDNSKSQSAPYPLMILSYMYACKSWDVDRDGALSDAEMFALLVIKFSLSCWRTSARFGQSKIEALHGDKLKIIKNSFVVPEGFIAPYASVQYGLLEHENGFKPQGAKDLFNHRHSLLRNMTGKTLMALKERFPILMAAPL
ncbi:putative nuclease HARBI1 [Tanacetum coccineum]